MRISGTLPLRGPDRTLTNYSILWSPKILKTLYLIIGNRFCKAHVKLPKVLWKCSPKGVCGYNCKWIGLNYKILLFKFRLPTTLFINSRKTFHLHNIVYLNIELSFPYYSVSWVLNCSSSVHAFYIFYENSAGVTIVTFPLSLQYLQTDKYDVYQLLRRCSSSTSKPNYL